MTPNKNPGNEAFTRSRTFQISEEDLSELESNLSLIFDEGVDWLRFNDRQDLREAWEMTIKTLSNVRFRGGPPKHVEIHPVE